MKATDQPTKTRVFRAGNSQAVRIPKAFELPPGEVLIERREGGVFISTLRGRWDLFLSGPGVELPFTAEDLRHQGPERSLNLDGLRETASRPPRARPAKKAIKKP
jgi:virulence-associated protein VagC